MINQSKPRILFTTRLKKQRLAALQSSGFLVESVPFITFEYVIPAMWISQLPDQTDAWIFTSKKAVKAIKPAFKDLEVPDHIFAVGSKTAGMLEELNLEVTIPDEYNVVALAKKMKELELKNVTHFCGNLKAGDLNKLLGEDVNLTSVEVYRTKLAPHTLNISNYDGIVFMSPSAVESFSERNEINGTAKVFCIGPTTEAAATEVGFENCITPEYSTLDDLTESIQNYFN
ncbi:MAG: uroporphyrinogen-III synthase [Gracilimonas sp.]|uniref:uroporphyrinogen-III synthase n=1 Tax=Gracilimonas TaxID=649462 RepID=UPI001B167281|nr:uroporphyrinogen-III synthase [Gracilimonas sp.]MBO6585619.1 uroporphyrinogen-III synthase [Gracilimonas sp.]MBO6616616.1 uroporphyrinogen-III synthase [Gracilimonas sp.]